MIRIKRVYDPPEPGDGARFLVDRLWPRGVKRESLLLDGWLKDVAPSDGLRRWFGYGPARWEEFRRRYSVELDGKPEAWRPLVQAARKGTVTLLYSARETAHNNAVALKEYLGKNWQMRESRDRSSQRIIGRDPSGLRRASAGGPSTHNGVDAVGKWPGSPGVLRRCEISWDGQ